MIYSHSRDESAEILRRCIAVMGQHPAGFHPRNYTVWYEALGGVNPTLARELQQLLSTGSKVNDEDLGRLYAAHISGRDLEATERAHRDLRRLLEDAGSSMISGGEALEGIQGTLQSASVELHAAASQQAASQWVARLLPEIARVCEVLRHVGAKLLDTRLELVQVVEKLDQVQHEPLRDPLTGLCNHLGFQRALERHMASGHHLATAFMAAFDIDEFKSVNDSYGHVMGDKVLCKMGEILREHLVDKDHLVGRIGGDEFVVLLWNVTLAEAVERAEQIRAAVERLSIVVHDVKYIDQVSVSVGVAQGKSDDTLESLRHRADATMYRAKRKGKNQVAQASGA